MPAQGAIALLPDAGPLITLAYADALDILFKPGWELMVVDMVQHEVTRNQTPTSHKLADWMAAQRIPVLSTKTFQHVSQVSAEGHEARKKHLGELAIQETMNEFALMTPVRHGVFLFEDHKIAGTSFLLPDNCRKISTRAFLLFLERQGWIDSAAEIERRAIRAGREFSRLRFPP